MQKILLVASLVMVFGGCKDKWDKALSDFEGLKDKMCECKDAACADKVDADLDS